MGPCPQRQCLAPPPDPATIMSAKKSARRVKEVLPMPALSGIGWWGHYGSTGRWRVHRRAASREPNC